MNGQKSFTSLQTTKIYFYASVLILGLALSIRLLGLDKGIWIDEYFAISRIFQKSFWEMLQNARTGNHIPLYYILLYCWGKISHSEEFIRLLSVGFYLGTLI